MPYDSTTIYQMAGFNLLDGTTIGFDEQGYSSLCSWCAKSNTWTQNRYYLRFDGTYGKPVASKFTNDDFQDKVESEQFGFKLSADDTITLRHKIAIGSWISR